MESVALRESRAALQVRNSVKCLLQSIIRSQATLSDDFQARLAARAAALYNPRATRTAINWMGLVRVSFNALQLERLSQVYDERDAQTVPDVDENEADNEEFGGLFKISVAQRTRDALRSDIRDQLDCCAYREARVPGNWGNAEVGMRPESLMQSSHIQMRISIADCFVTGQWTAEGDAFNEGAAEDVNDEDDDMDDSEMSGASDEEMSEDDEDEEEVEEDDDEEKQQSQGKGEKYSEGCP